VANNANKLQKCLRIVINANAIKRGNGDSKKKLHSRTKHLKKKKKNDGTRGGGAQSKLNNRATVKPGGVTDASLRGKRNLSRRPKNQGSPNLDVWKRGITIRSGSQIGSKNTSHKKRKGRWGRPKTLSKDIVSEQQVKEGR